MINLYEILEISSQANETEIKKAYKRKAVEFHPDKNLNDPKAEESFKAINTAYQILSDSFKKAEYDFQLQQSLLQPAPVYTNSSGKQYQHRPNPTYTTKTKEPYKPPMSKKEVWAFAVGLVFLIGLASYSFIQYKNYNVNQNVEKAKVLFELGDEEGAISSVSKALNQDIESVEAHAMYARILDVKKNRTKSAIHHSSEAILLSDVFLPEMHLIRASSLVRKRKYAKALLDIELLLGNEISNEKVNLLMSEVQLYHLRGSEKAIFYAEKAIQLNPTSSDAYLTKGIAEQKASKNELSNLSFLKARELNDRNGIVYYYMGLNELAFYKDTINACNHFSYARNLGVRESEYYIRKFCK